MKVLVKFLGLLGIIFICGEFMGPIGVPLAVIFTIYYMFATDIFNNGKKKK